MRKTMNKNIDFSEMITVDIDGLAAMLSCGQATARKIGEEACARVVMGRRVLYSVKKVQKYVEAVAM